MVPVLNEKRWVTIASSLKNAILAGELPAGARIASEVEMANQWNVSPMTVHRALTELQRDGWVVRRRRAGTVVADRSAQPVIKIALVCTNYTDLPQAAYFNGIEEGLSADQYLLPLSTGNNPQEEARCLKRALAECAAIICYPTGAPENTPLLQQAAATLPLLFIDCTIEGVDADAVMTDNAGSMQLGLRHLQQLGHTRIGYFMQHPQPVSSARDRLAGYLAFQKDELGQADPQRLVRSFSVDLSWSDYYHAVEAALIELLKQPEPITALACQQDTQMILVQEACVRLGIALPDDLAVLSFSNSA
ncbi:MAG: GntR family transcriptional regulator, partial [Armatimonas sp.]